MRTGIQALAALLFFLATLNVDRLEQVARFGLGPRGGLCQPLLYLISNFLLLPFGLILIARMLERRIVSQTWRGVLIGFTYAVWANAVLLGVMSLLQAQELQDSWGVRATLLLRGRRR